MLCPSPPPPPHTPTHKHPQIQLEPVSLRLAAPDAVQFHADLTDLIEKGIRHQQTRHVRTGERTDFVMEPRRGACRLSQYYVQVRGHVCKGGVLWVFF